MGRLAGFKHREVIQRLRERGFELERQAKGSHELWRHPETKRRATVPKHAGDLPEGTLRSIRSQAGISVDDFLASVESGDSDTL